MPATLRGRYPRLKPNPRPLPRKHPYALYDEMFLLTGGRPREFQRLFREVWGMPYVVTPQPRWT